MSENSGESTLISIDPWKIEPNRDNPRRLFDEEDLEYLKQSIKGRGILVPLIVYKNNEKDEQYILLDGERRLRCAQALSLRSVPANVIAAPDRSENILLMFNIHNVRKDWELVPTALKLELLVRLLTKKNGEEPTNRELSKLTGLSTIRIADCKRVLKYKKYHELTLHKDPSQRIGGDFFSQLDLALEKLDAYPEITKEFSRDKIVDLIIKKRQEGTIKTFMEFRMLKKVLISESKGVKKDLIVKRMKEFLHSQPVRDTAGTIVKPAISIAELYESTSRSTYVEQDIIKESDKLSELLDQVKGSKIKDEKVRDALSYLAALINEALRY
ncbi:MAG: ParB/RepB/Spo0J family partition protein [Thaumarchaeota archaeon]|nr:ParB/RepB/Spo0J family partition protein [Nitrososphaerota archaeon]